MDHNVDSVNMDEDTSTEIGRVDDQNVGSNNKQEESNKIILKELAAKVATLEKKNKALEHQLATVNDATISKKKKRKKKEAKNREKVDGFKLETEQKMDDNHKIMESNPRVDISAWDHFSLDGRILSCLSCLGFSAPTHIQAECLPAAIRDRRDIIGAAQTGSGKTIAFGLPIIHVLAEKKQANLGQVDQSKNIPSVSNNSLKALILAPTRELALQVKDHLEPFARSCNVWIVPIVGGLSSLKQERLLNKHPEIVVATPGRLWDLMRDGQAPHLSNLHNLEFLVIDEADRMVQQGHYSELSSIFNEIKSAKATNDDQVAEEIISRDENDSSKPPEEEPLSNVETESWKNKNPRPGPSERPLQISVFSATLTLPSSLRKRLRKGGGGSSGSATLDDLMDKVPFVGLRKPKIVDLTTERRLADRVLQSYVSCPESERDVYLYYLLACHPGRTIVFMNAISSVRRVSALLRYLGLPAHPIHAGMQQRARLKALDRFKQDPNAIMLATDVAARGLDIKNVRCVIHYQLPASVDTYVHRCGRTARAENEGVAIALVTPKDDARFISLTRSLQGGLKEQLLNGNSQMGTENGLMAEFPIDPSILPEIHRRVSLAVSIDSIERGEKKAKADISWKRLHAEELGIDLSEDEGRDNEPQLGSTNTSKRNKNKATGLENLKSELLSLLSQPLQPKYSEKYFTGGAVAGVQYQSTFNAQTCSDASKLVDASKKDSFLAEENSVQAATISTALSLAAAKVASKTVSVKKNKTISNSDSRPKDHRVKQPKVTRQDALKAAISKHYKRKSTKRSRQGLVVVGQAALGRISEGPDALAALKSRIKH